MHRLQSSVKNPPEGRGSGVDRAKGVKSTCILGYGAYKDTELEGVHGQNLPKREKEGIQWIAVEFQGQESEVINQCRSAKETVLSYLCIFDTVPIASESTCKSGSPLSRSSLSLGLITE